MGKRPIAARCLPVVFLALAWSAFGASGCRDSDKDDVDGTGGQPGSGGGAGWLADGKLPTAFVGVPYRFELAEAEPLALGDGWKLTSGTLPSGLKLRESGVIEGTPAAEGRAHLELRREANGQTESYEARLDVSRKRWVAYLSDERALGQHLLYVADLSGGEPTTKLLTDDGQARAEVLPGHYAFAPRNEALAYLVDASRDGVRELYGVDLSGGKVGRPIRLDQGAHVKSFSWSPDARHVAYVSEDDEGVHAFVASWPFEGMRELLGPAGGQGHISWVHRGLVIFQSGQSSSSVARRTDYGFEVAGSVPVAGRVLRAQGERVVLGRELYLCSGAWHFVDLENGGEVHSAPFGAALHVEPRLEYSARVEQGSLWLATGRTELAQLPLGACDAVSWSKDGQTLISLDESRRLRVTKVSNQEVAHEIVPGEYEAVLERPRPELDEAGRWLKFHDREGLYVSRLENAQPAPAFSVRDLLANTGSTIEDSRFLREAELVFLARDEQAASLHLLDLKKSPPQLRTLAPLPQDGYEPVGLVGGLRDGSWLGLSMRQRSPAGTVPSQNLWVIAGAGESPAVHPVALKLDCLPDPQPRGSPWGEKVWCETLRDALFQP